MRSSKMTRPNFNVFIKRHWFFIGVMASMLLAEVFPSIGASGGLLKPEWTVKYVAVGIIFFLSGLSIATNDVLLAVKKFRVHLFIQVYTFLLIPIFVLVVTYVLKKTFLFNEWVLKGLATMSCMPPPVTSAVILTRAVGGNEAIAVFNSIVGSIIGLIVTPLALFLILGTTAVVSIVSTIITLSQTVLLPFGIGQLARAGGFLTISTNVPSFFLNANIATVGQLTLLLNIYTTCCDSYFMYDIPMDAIDVMSTIFLVMVIHLAVIFGSFEVANYMKYRQCYGPEDIIAITFCSTHKSLTLGIPILRILFSGYSHFSQVTLPVLLYHLMQIVLGGFMSPHLRRWLTVNKNKSLLPA